MVFVICKYRYFWGGEGGPGGECFMDRKVSGGNFQAEIFHRRGISWPDLKNGDKLNKKLVFFTESKEQH